MNESWVSLYISLGKKNFNINKKNRSDIQSILFGMQLEIKRSNDKRQENFQELSYFTIFPYTVLGEPISTSISISIEFCLSFL